MEAGVVGPQGQLAFGGVAREEVEDGSGDELLGLGEFAGRGGGGEG